MQESEPKEADSVKENTSLYEPKEFNHEKEIASLHAKVAELEESNSAKVIAALSAKVAELEGSDPGKVIAALHGEITELKAALSASELLSSNDDIDLEEEEESTNDASTQDRKKSAMKLLLKYLINLLASRDGSKYKDMSEQEKRDLGTVSISGIEIAKPLYDAWKEWIPENEVTNFILSNQKCVGVVNNLFYKNSVFSMPYMGKIGKDFNVLFIGSFNLRTGSMTYGTIDNFIKPFSKFISSRRQPSSSPTSSRAPFDVGFVVANLCNPLLPSQALGDLQSVFRYMKKCPHEGNNDLHELYDQLLSQLKTMNQNSELVHEKLLTVLLDEIKTNTKAVNCGYVFFSEKANGIFNDASSIYAAVEKVQGENIPIVKTGHLCSGGLSSGNKSANAMKQARDTVTDMVQLGMTTDHQCKYTTQDTKSILEVENDAGITWMETFCSQLKFVNEIDEHYQATVNQRRLENKQRKAMLGIATASTLGAIIDDKIIWIGEDLNEPIRTSTVKKYTDELVNNHANLCKKKGEEEKEVDREYVRRERVVKRMNTEKAVYRGGPKIADSVEKLKSNLPPHVTLRANTDDTIISILLQT